MRYLLALALVLLGASPFAALAGAQVSISCGAGAQCYQGEAYAECMRIGGIALAWQAANYPSEAQQVTGQPSCVMGVEYAPPSYTAYSCRLPIKTGSFYNCSSYVSSSTTYFVSTRTCQSYNVDFPPGDMQPAQAQPPSDCYGGCKVSGTPVSASTGGITVYGMVNRYYTGETCTKTNDSNAPIDARAEVQKETGPKSPECNALGNGQTACMKPNGDYCATASTGKTFCWTPGQEGAQVDGEQAQVKGKTGDPVKPPDAAIPDKEWQRKEGHQVTECTGTACKTFNVTNFTTVPQGTAKNSTGDNKPDGSGNTSGNGQNEEGGKDSATDSGNCQTPPICVGDTLKCLQLRYTWKIECNTKGNEVTAGVGCSEGDVPVCAGSSCKAEAYASVLQQWKQRCALEAMAQGNKARADGIDNGADAGVAEGIWNSPGGNGPLTLRTDLVQVGGGGPLLPDIEIEGQSWNVPDGFYDAVAAVKMVIVAVCTVIAMFVVGRNI
jgi:hypothetical protein